MIHLVRIPLLGSARASRAGDGALAIATVSDPPRSFTVPALKRFGEGVENFPADKLRPDLAQIPAAKPGSK